MPKILIVEDDPFIAMDLEDTFLSEGYEVLGPIATVDAGLSLLKEEKPDVAMLDYNLGRETSIPIARALNDNSIPFFFLSGQIKRVIIDNDVAGIKVIPKPFIPEKLVQEVQALSG
ncbi:response regulator [Fretibacter rubidus]|uniref:response regulator n=1 Tax=Fretibacter rubidus TaxID=570162 RepID=UPI00352A2CAE